MARLILSLDGQVLAEYNMSKERYTVGRLPDNDIRIDNPAVSGHHSLIINILNDSFLEDLNSTNGTYVNGKLIKKHALQNGDVITVGHHQLRFVDQRADDLEQDEFERTMVIPPSAAQVASARERAVAAGAASEAAVRPAKVPKLRRVRLVMASSSAQRCEVVGKRGDLVFGVAARNPVHDGRGTFVGAELGPDRKEFVPVIACDGCDRALSGAILAMTSGAGLSDQRLVGIGPCGTNGRQRCDDRSEDRETGHCSRLSRVPRLLRGRHSQHRLSFGLDQFPLPGPKENTVLSARRHIKPEDRTQPDADPGARQGCGDP